MYVFFFLTLLKIDYPSTYHDAPIHLPVLPYAICLAPCWSSSICQCPHLPAHVRLLIHIFPPVHLFPSLPAHPIPPLPAHSSLTVLPSSYTLPTVCPCPYPSTNPSIWPLMHFFCHPSTCSTIPALALHSLFAISPTFSVDHPSTPSIHSSTPHPIPHVAQCMCSALCLSLTVSLCIHVLPLAHAFCCL